MNNDTIQTIYSQPSLFKDLSNLELTHTELTTLLDAYDHAPFCLTNSLRDLDVLRSLENKGFLKCEVETTVAHVDGESFTCFYFHITTQGWHLARSINGGQHWFKAEAK